jgi:hypothetical protein
MCTVIYRCHLLKKSFNYISFTFQKREVARTYGLMSATGDLWSTENASLHSFALLLGFYKVSTGPVKNQKIKGIR